jgi:hypothetical protein
MHLWTVLCSLEQEGGMVLLLVGKFCHQTLSSTSCILKIYRKKQGWIMTSVSFRSELGITSWMTVQKLFSQSEQFFFPVVFLSSQLSWTHWSLRFPISEFLVVLNKAEVMLAWQHGQFIQPFLAHGVACECLSFQAWKIDP